MGEFSKRGVHETDEFWWVIFQRGEYTKPMSLGGWFFKGGSTQDRWVVLPRFAASIHSRSFLTSRIPRGPQSSVRVGSLRRLSEIRSADSGVQAALHRTTPVVYRCSALVVFNVPSTVKRTPGVEIEREKKSEVDDKIRKKFGFFQLENFFLFEKWKNLTTSYSVIGRWDLLGAAEFHRCLSGRLHGLSFVGNWHESFRQFPISKAGFFVNFHLNGRWHVLDENGEGLGHGHGEVLLQDLWRGPADFFLILWINPNHKTTLKPIQKNPKKLKKNFWKNQKFFWKKNFKKNQKKTFEKIQQEIKKEIKSKNQIKRIKKTSQKIKSKKSKKSKENQENKRKKF